jgi:hypothetical protein
MGPQPCSPTLTFFKSGSLIVTCGPVPGSGEKCTLLFNSFSSWYTPLLLALILWRSGCPLHLLPLSSVSLCTTCCTNLLHLQANPESTGALTKVDLKFTPEASTELMLPFRALVSQRLDDANRSCRAVLVGEMPDKVLDIFLRS